MLSPADFGRLFSDFRSSAFRLEALSLYRVPDEAAEVAAYRDGGAPPGGLGGDNEWRQLLRAGRSVGKRFSRVRVIRGPLTDYERYACEWGYVYNTALGEDIRVLDLSEVDYPHALPPWDFWLFDEGSGVRMHYADDGQFEGAETVGSEEVGRLIAWQQQLVGSAVPFDEYWAAHPQYHRRP